MDVDSLFTNVPITETISIITNISFTDTDVFNGFNKQQCTKLLCLVVQDNVLCLIINYLSKLMVRLWEALLNHFLIISFLVI